MWESLDDDDMALKASERLTFELIGGTPVHLFFWGGFFVLFFFLPFFSI